MSENIAPNHNQPPAIESGLSPEAMFEGFDWKPDSKPQALTINPAGFAEDGDGNWYMVRKARNAVDLDSAQPEDLYNGPGDQYWNASEGRGLYFTNHPEAAEKLKISLRPSREPGELYICKVKPEPKKVLNVTESLKRLSGGQKAAAMVLASRSVIGIPLTNRNTYDRLYGDAKIVVTPPLAGSRVYTGGKVRLSNDKPLKIRWAIVRDPSLVEVVAHRSVDQTAKR